MTEDGIGRYGQYQARIGGFNWDEYAVAGKFPERLEIKIPIAGRGFLFHNSEDENSILEGFTIMNGHLSDEDGAGILRPAWQGED